MSRNRRPYCPGLAFHITTRLTGHFKHFDPPMRRAIVSIFEEAATRSDTQVLAYAIMESHLHLVVRQQEDPLSSLMQPALRRVALAMMRTRRVEGHIFERRFGAVPIHSASQLRNAIIYTHLNPVRGGLCDDAGAADSTSHHIYASSELADATEWSAHMKPTCEIFSSDRDATADEWRDSYLNYLRYRQQCDKEDACGMLRSEAAPDCGGGDTYFASRFATHATVARPEPTRKDLRDIALICIASETDELPLRCLRGTRVGSRKLQRLRHRIIRHAYAAGHSGVAIAAFFAMSPSSVSEIARAS